MLSSLIAASLIAATQPPQAELIPLPSTVCLTNACREWRASQAAERPYSGAPRSVYDRVLQRPDMSSEEILAMLRAENFGSAALTADLQPGELMRGEVVTLNDGRQSQAILRQNADGTVRMAVPVP